jgi:hypothetical protein
MVTRIAPEFLPFTYFVLLVIFVIKILYIYFLLRFCTGKCENIILYSTKPKYASFFLVLFCDPQYKQSLLMNYCKGWDQICVGQILIRSVKIFKKLNSFGGCCKTNFKVLLGVQNFNSNPFHLHQVYNHVYLLWSFRNYSLFHSTFPLAQHMIVCSPMLYNTRHKKYGHTYNLFLQRVCLRGKCRYLGVFL